MGRLSQKVEAADDAELFLEAVKAVKPLANRDTVATKPPPAGARPPVARQQAKWLLERDEVCGTHRGRGATTSESTLLQLERGRIKPALSIDLHGQTLAQARDTITRAIKKFQAASGNGVEHCLLVIHGKGRHSDGAAVLKEHLPEMVTNASGVVAFATAATRDGGTGATYVLVRRP